jgi:outer membrane protein
MLNGSCVCLCLHDVRLALIAAVAMAGAAWRQAAADTLEGAPALAYRNNPQLNSQCAATRATDESVGIALSGYRPKVTTTAHCCGPQALAFDSP